jgi:hypothetical protein
MDTQTQIDRLIELAIVQRTELKQLVEQLPQLREHLNAEIEKVFDEVEPQLRVELEDWTAKQTADQTAKLGASLEAKITELAKELEVSTQARYSAILAEREKNFALAAEAEAKIAEHAASLPEAVKGIVDAELARFPRAGEIDQLRKEFAEPKSLNPRGKWQAGVAYNKLDLVTLNGDSYTSAKDDNRTRPSRSSADWTLVAARGTGGGGGGVTSLTDLVPVPQNGELLIGNGSAFVNNTLTAGTGVTITNGAGTITIDATGAQEILTATVKNAESVAITKGQVVYLFSATGGFPSVKLAYNTTDATSAKTFGVVSDTSIAPNGTGTVTCVGVVSNLNLGAYNDGDTVYLGATPGSFTATKPYAPNHLVYVGIIERANAGNGELYVRIQNGYELDEIHDVQILTPPAAGAVLVRDNTNSLWKAAQISGTANQITVTNADAAVTLSIPTNPTLNGNLTVSGTGTSTIGGDLTVTGTGGGVSSIGRVGLNGIGPAGVLSITSDAKTAADAIGLTFLGKDSANNAQTYAAIRALIEDPTSTSEDGAIQMFTVSAGTVAEKARLTSTGNYLLGTTTDGGQKLQVAGSARWGSSLSFPGYNGYLTTGSTDSGLNPAITRNLIGSTGTSYTIANGELGAYRAIELGSSIRFLGADGTFTTGQSITPTEMMRLTYTGNALLGTPTDSGNGRIQLATHTTSAGGIGLGTDTALYRTAAGRLLLQQIGGTSPLFGLSENGTTTAEFQSASGDVYLTANTAGKSLILRTVGTTALTLDASQNATFAGTVRVNGQLNAANGTTYKWDTSGDVYARQVFSGAGGTDGVKLTQSGGVGIVAAIGSGGLSFRDDGNNQLLNLADATGNATFAGAIAIGNTVNTVSPTSPNRTITMVIGGTTYYIHAKTTND